jgi:hypothetical protein
MQTASIAFEVSESMCKSFATIGTPEERQHKAMGDLCDRFKEILSNMTDNANYCKNRYHPTLIRLEAALKIKAPMKE